MGVDFFPCDRCGESICDCGDYIRCCDNCGRRWCGMECAAADGFVPESGDGDMQDRTCNFCRNEDVEDSPLLHYLLKRFGLSLKKAKKMYLNTQKKRSERERQDT